MWVLCWLGGAAVVSAAEYKKYTYAQVWRDLRDLEATCETEMILTTPQELWPEHEWAAEWYQCEAEGAMRGLAEERVKEPRRVAPEPVDEAADEGTGAGQNLRAHDELHRACEHEDEDESVLQEVVPRGEREACRIPLVLFGVLEEGARAEGEAIRGSTAPAVFISGSMHGNERMGVPVVMELARLLCGKEFHARWNRTQLVLMPFANAWGYSWDRRTEGGADPNRDFPLEQGRPCFRTFAARAINQAFAQWPFHAALTFHGGMRSLSMPWGTPGDARHTRKGWVSDAVPDSVAQEALLALAQGAAGRDGLGQPWYPAGSHAALVYPAANSFEDWAFAHAFKYPATCGSGLVEGSRPMPAYKPVYSYVGDVPGNPPGEVPSFSPLGGSIFAEMLLSQDETLRAAARLRAHAFRERAVAFLVEMDDAKDPPLAAYGTRRDDVWLPRDDDGHIARNLRLALTMMHHVAPYLTITAGASPVVGGSSRTPGTSPVEVVVTEGTPLSLFVEGAGCETFSNLVCGVTLGDCPANAGDLAAPWHLHETERGSTFRCTPAFGAQAARVPLLVELPALPDTATVCVVCAAEFDADWSARAAQVTHLARARDAARPYALPHTQWARLPDPALPFGAPRALLRPGDTVYSNEALAVFPRAPGQIGWRVDVAQGALLAKTRPGGPAVRYHLETDEWRIDGDLEPGTYVLYSVADMYSVGDMELPGRRLVATTSGGQTPMTAPDVSTRRLDAEIGQINGADLLWLRQGGEARHLADATTTRFDAGLRETSWDAPLLGEDPVIGDGPLLNRTPDEPLLHRKVDAPLLDRAIEGTLLDSVAASAPTDAGFGDSANRNPVARFNEKVAVVGGRTERERQGFIDVTDQAPSDDTKEAVPITTQLDPAAPEPDLVTPPPVEIGRVRVGAATTTAVLTADSRVPRDWSGAHVLLVREGAHGWLGTLQRPAGYEATLAGAGVAPATAAQKDCLLFEGDSFGGSLTIDGDTTTRLCDGAGEPVTLRGPAECCAVQNARAPRRDVTRRSTRADAGTCDCPLGTPLVVTRGARTFTCVMSAGTSARDHAVATERLCAAAPLAPRRTPQTGPTQANVTYVTIVVVLSVLALVGFALWHWKGASDELVSEGASYPFAAPRDAQPDSPTTKPPAVLTP